VGFRGLARGGLTYVGVVPQTRDEASNPDPGVDAVAVGVTGADVTRDDPAPATAEVVMSAPIRRWPLAVAVPAAFGVVLASVAIGNPWDLVVLDEHLLAIVLLGASACGVLGVALRMIRVRRRWWSPAIGGFGALALVGAIGAFALAALMAVAAKFSEPIEQRTMRASDNHVVVLTWRAYGIGPDSSCLSIDLRDGDGFFATHQRSICVHHESKIEASLVDANHLVVQLDYEGTCVLTIDWKRLSLAPPMNATGKCEELRVG